jgi:hypothetical protein
MMADDLATCSPHLLASLGALAKAQGRPRYEVTEAALLRYIGEEAGKLHQNGHDVSAILGPITGKRSFCGGGGKNQ